MEELHGLRVAFNMYLPSNICKIKLEKWNFPLNFITHRKMEWRLWEQLYNFPNCVFPDSLNNSNSFQSKMLYIVLVFKWSCLDTLLSILNLCRCHKLFNRTQTFGKAYCIQKIPEKVAQVHHQTCLAYNFWDMEFLYPPYTGWWNEPKTF